MGIDVTAYRYVHTVVGGALAGIGGACFSLQLTPQWVAGLTGGAGWIAVALVIFAFWRADLCLLGAYLFGAFSALPLTLQARGWLTEVPSEVFQSLPYVMTIVVLVAVSSGAAKRGWVLRTLGISCRKNGRTGSTWSPHPSFARRSARLRSEHPDAVPIQGGTDVMVALNFDRMRPETILNLNEVAELRGWSRMNGSAQRSRRVTYGEAMDEALASLLPALAEASRTVRSPQIRSRARSAGTSARRPRPGTRSPCSWSAQRSSSRASGALAASLSRTSSSGRAERPRRRRARRRRRGHSRGQPQTFMKKVGPRNAMVIAVCSLAVVADRERRADPRLVRLGGTYPRSRGLPSTRRPTPERVAAAAARSTTCAALRPTAVMRSASSPAARSSASREALADRQRRTA